MNVFHDTHIDFMKYRRFWIVVSVLVMLGGVVGFFVHGRLNVGIEFAGGTQITVRLRDAVDADRLRGELGAAGIAAQIQQYGPPEDRSFLIKVAAASGEADIGSAVFAALDAGLGRDKGQPDLNRQGADTLAQRFAELDPRGLGPTAAAAYADLVETILTRRRELGVLSSWDEVAQLPGVGAEVARRLSQGVTIGPYSILGSEAISAQVGGELRRRGLVAVGLALLGMLVYIGFRFQLPYGIGAIVASLHDVLVVMALFVILRFELNLTTIAGLLTLVGYSVNDTVVVFDRVREVQRQKRRMALLDVMNLSLNQTLSRTILTSGTTLLAAGSLLAFGGEQLRGFSFIMTAGVIVGTYSSIYIACPFALLWIDTFRRARTRPRATAAPPAPLAG